LNLIKITWDQGFKRTYRKKVKNDPSEGYTSLA
jgi:hypothetical protein